MPALPGFLPVAPDSLRALLTSWAHRPARVLLLAALVALLVLLALALAHLLFWGWVYRVAPRQDELRYAPTRDGWRLAIARRTPRGAGRAPPVLLCHGLAVNRGGLDFGIDRYSLSLYLAQHGFDCFALELRGHGASRPARRDAARGWSFDTYLQEDVPAALDEIQAATGAARVLWVGHSQGALLGLAAAGAYPDRISGVVALAPPTHFHAQEELRRLLWLAVLARGRGQRWLARAAAPFTFALHPALFDLAIHAANTEPRVLRQILTNVIEDVSPGVRLQFLDWARQDRFGSADGATDYRLALGAARQPALFLAGARDRLAPPASVQAGHDLWGGDKELFVAGTAAHLSVDYGHSDLIFGRSAPEEIFPRVRDWLVRHSREGQTP